MWFDIVRKKVVNMQVVKDVMHHLNGVFYYSKSMSRQIKNDKYRDALLTYNYIRDFMYALEWDEYDEQYLPKVTEIEAYTKRFDKILKKLHEWYNSIPRETKSKSRNLFREINKELNSATSLLLDSDFVFQKDKPDYLGTYYPKTDTSTVNLPAQADLYSTDKKLIQRISETLSHEFGHQASRSIDSPTLGDNFYEEMLAYLVEYPTNKEQAFEGWLNHPAVIESVERDRSGRKRQLYDDIDMAVKTGAMRDMNESLSDRIENLLRIHGPTANKV